MAADNGAFAIRDDLSDIPMKEWHYVGEVSRAKNTRSPALSYVTIKLFFFYIINDN